MGRKMFRFEVGDTVIVRMPQATRTGTVTYRFLDTSRVNAYIVDLGNGYESLAHEGLISNAPKTHTFGGVVFEETGEVRQPQTGEWWLMDDNRICLEAFGPLYGPHPILKPVRIEEVEHQDDETQGV